LARIRGDRAMVVRGYFVDRVERLKNEGSVASESNNYSLRSRPNSQRICVEEPAGLFRPKFKNAEEKEDLKKSARVTH
jgi:hypothetical protein